MIKLLLMMMIILIASGGKYKILEFFKNNQDLCSLGHIRRGLFYEKILFLAKNPLPSEIENFGKYAIL